LNRLEKVIDPLLQEINTRYEDADRQVIETDKRNLVKTTQLDALGRLVSVTRSGITLEQHEYDGNNNRTESTDAKGNVTVFEYDGANRLIARTDGFDSEDETTTTFTYDKVGNLLTEKDGRVTGQPFDIQNTYDELNRPRFVEDGEGNVTEFQYDGEGNRTAQIEPEGQRTEFDYGELNELVEVRMPDTGLFSYGYDPNRNRIRQTDGEGNLVTFTYDPLNRLDLMIQDPQPENPEGFHLVTDHDYDPNGNETKLIDPKGQVVDFKYDELNRLEKKIYNLTADDFALFTRTHEITFHYDPNDNLEQIDELKSSGTDPPALVLSFKTYDDLDRLETETDAFGKTDRRFYPGMRETRGIFPKDVDRVASRFG
jgi:YD repeat-containing protein